MSVPDLPELKLSCDVIGQASVQAWQHLDLQIIFNQSFMIHPASDGIRVNPDVVLPPGSAFYGGVHDAYGVLVVLPEYTGFLLGRIARSYNIAMADRK